MEWLSVVGWMLFAMVAFAVGRALVDPLCDGDRWLRAGLAIPLMLAILGVSSYSLGLFRYGRGTAVVATALPVLLAAAISRRRGYPSLDRADHTVAAVFLIAGVLMLILRALDPTIDAVGGEKFLDYGLLRSILRAEMLPPVDPWFAGEGVRYYYGGQLVVASIALVLDVHPAVAFNLGVVFIYATVVATSAAIGASLSARSITGAVGSAIAVGVASNLMPGVRLLVGMLPGPLQEAVAQPIAASTSYDVSYLTGGASEFFYWRASRVVPGTITEFPLFAFRNGDLHAHMLGMPTVLAATGLAVALLRTEPGQRRRWWLITVLGLLAGWQAVQNTWDVPIILGLLGLAGMLGAIREGQIPLWAVRRAVMGVAVGTVVAALVAMPFLLTGIAGGPARTLAVVPTAMRTTGIAMLGVYGGFVLFVGTALFRRPRAQQGWMRLIGITCGLALLWAVGWGALATPLLLFGGALVWWRLNPDRPGVTMLLVAGGTLMIVPEVIYLQEQAAPGRFNTAFKIGAQVWLLLGVAIGPLLAHLLGRTRWRLMAVVAIGGGVLMLVYAPLTVGGLMIEAGPMTLDGSAQLGEAAPGVAPAVTWLSQQAGQPTIVEAPGTQWYPDGTDGRDHLPYSMQSNPASSLTGIPTVAGWSHEEGYRGVDPYRVRVRAVDVIYTGDPDERARLLEQYDVQYIWVGPAERLRYGERITIGEDRPVIYAGGEVVIYAGVTHQPG